MFDVANVTFDGVADDEKKIYTGDFEATGEYLGYKPRQQWV